MFCGKEKKLFIKIRYLIEKLNENTK